MKFAKSNSLINKYEGSIKMLVRAHDRELKVMVELDDERKVLIKLRGGIGKRHPLYNKVLEECIAKGYKEE